MPPATTLPSDLLVWRRRRMGLSGTPLDFLGRAPGTLGALTWATWYARTRGGQNAVLTR
jgi:hypothetical protein